MKTKNKFLLFVMSFVMLVAVLMGNTAKYEVMARDEEIQSNTIATQIAISDRYEVQPGAPLPADPTKLDDPALGGVLTFTGTLQSVLLNIYRDYNPAYQGSYVCKNMFQYFTKLDLTNIGYGTSQKIEWGDFNYLFMPNLKELNLSNNGLTEFKLTVLPGVEYIEDESRYIVNAGSPAYSISTLNLSNNMIEGALDFSAMYELTNLNLANNKITSVKVNSNQTKDCRLDYRGNKIKKIADLVLPNTANTTLILYGNPFEVSTFANNIKVEIGLFNMGDTINSDARIKYIEFSELNIEIKIYTKSVAADETVTYTEYNYNPNNLTDFEFSLPAGYYKVEYVNGDDSSILSSSEIKVAPPMPAHYFIIKGEIYDNYTDKIKKGKVVINKDKDGNIANPNIKTYYRFNTSVNWTEGDEIDLTEKSGSYTVHIKAIENGVESEVKVLFVQVSYSKILPDVLIVVLLIVVLVVLALVVVPLIKKLLDKISK